MTRLPALNIQRRHIVIAIIALLLALLILTGSMTAGRQRAQLAAGREELLSRVNTELSYALSQLEQAGGFGLEDYRQAIAAIRRHLYAADALNSVLTVSYGDNAAVFDKELYNELETALNACDSAIELGLSMDEPMAQLKAFMDQLQETVNAKFGPGALMAIPSTLL